MQYRLTMSERLDFCKLNRNQLGSELPFAALCIKGRIRLIPPPASKKSVAIPPRPTYHEGKPDGGIFRDHNAGSVGTLTLSTISRFCASDIPAEYNP